MKTQALLTFAATAVLVLMLSACQNADASHHEQARSADSTPAPVPVEVNHVDRATLHASYTTTSTLEAYDEADVTPRVSGIIENVLVEEGDRVEQGQVIAELDKERFEQAVQQVAAELRGVRQELERMREMASRQMASADAVERLQANYDALNARLRLAQIDLEAATIRAPINGVISQRYAKTGNLVQQHSRQSLFHIVDLSRLQATIHVPERDIHNVSVGQNVLLDLSHNQVEASVSRISPAVDRVAGTFRVMVDIDNPQHLLRAGMFARVQLQYARFDNTLRVPQYALVQLDGQQYVYVVETGIAKRRAVHTGVRQGEWIQIIDGISEGDAIVVTGQNNLNDNAPVVAVAGRSVNPA